MYFKISLLLALTIFSFDSKEQGLFITLGSIDKYNDRLDSIIDTSVKIEVIADGYQWSEGPLWIESEKMLIWSDVPVNIAYCWKPGGKVKEYLTPSGYTGSEKREGSNGLLLNPQNELILCQHGDRIVAKMDAPLNAPEPNFIPIAENYEGKKFNSPNDAAFGKDGSLYFTDPPYGLPGQDESEEKEINFNGIYRLDSQGLVTLMDKTLTRPNGIAFSKDFTKVYVANSDPDHAIWMEYDVDENGSFQNGKIFADKSSDVKEGKKGLPDGLKVNNQGIIFATGPGGVLIFDADGEHLGTINPGVAVANCALNSDESILYLTAHMYLAQVKLK